MADGVAKVDKTAKMCLTRVTRYDRSFRADGRDDQRKEGMTEMEWWRRWGETSEQGRGICFEKGKGSFVPDRSSLEVT